MEFIFYFFLFIAIFFQIFFLVSYLERSEYYEEESDFEELSEFLNVSLIIPAWNEESTINLTIDSLLKTSYPLEFLQIIIVNDGSTDNTWDQVQKYKNHKNIILIDKENGGKVEAVNYAIDHATGDLIATVDADTTLDKDSISIMVKEFMIDDNLSAIGSTVLIRDPKTFVQKAQKIEYQLFSFTKLILGDLGAALVLPGAFSMYRKEVFEKIGKFKDAHLLEDLELTFRMQKNKFKIRQSKNAFSYTSGPKSVKELFKQRVRWGSGFLMNSYDYRHLVGNKESSHFGSFALPMSLFSYISIPVVFILSWFFLIVNFIDKIKAYILVDWKGFIHMPNYSIESFGFQPTFFLLFFLYLTIIFMIFFGKNLVKDKSKNHLEILIFYLLYAVIVPLWVLKILYMIIFSKKTSWR